MSAALILPEVFFKIVYRIIKQLLIRVRILGWKNIPLSGPDIFVSINRTLDGRTDVKQAK